MASGLVVFVKLFTNNSTTTPTMKLTIHKHVKARENVKLTASASRKTRD